MSARSMPAPSPAASTSKIERWKVGTTDPALLEFNPLSKVPTLITDDGAVLYDSPVICEYLDSVGSAPKLFPAAGPARWKAIAQQALGDGILERHPAAPPRDRAAAGRWPQELHRAAAGQGEARARRAGEGRGQRSAISRRSARSPSAARWAISTSATPTSRGAPAIAKLDAWYAKVVKLPPLAETMPGGATVLPSWGQRSGTRRANEFLKRPAAPARSGSTARESPTSSTIRNLPRRRPRAGGGSMTSITSGPTYPVPA